MCGDVDRRLRIDRLFRVDKPSVIFPRFTVLQFRFLIKAK